MKKLIKLLGFIVGWLFLTLLVVVSFFVLSAVIVNRHELAAGLGLAIVVCAFAVAAAIFILLIWLVCRWYGFRSTFIVYGGFAVMVGLFYAEEDLRGWHAWQSFKQRSEAKGENLDFASLIPPPVPDERNFALSPVVESSYAGRLDRHGHRIEPPNTSVVNRMAMKIYREADSYKWPTNGNGNWATHTLTDLQNWQAYYHTPTTNFDLVPTNDFPVSPVRQSPAADVLLALSKFDSTVEELRLASRLPFSRYPINYDAAPPNSALIPHLSATKSCVQLLSLRALAELELGQSTNSLDDIKLAFRVIESMRQEPLLISHLVRVSELQMALQPVYEGLARNQWSDGELVELEHEMAKQDYLLDCQLSMRAERNYIISTIDYLRGHRRYFDSIIYFMFVGSIDDDYRPELSWQRIVTETLYTFIPNGWFYLNQKVIGEMHQRYTLQMCDTANHRIFPQISHELDEQLLSLRLGPKNFLARLFMPALTRCELKFGSAQSATDMARIACALERYRLKNGEYPESLATLSPQFIESVPHDVVGGQPLKYLRTDDGRFVLYSIGWNETDDGGQVALRKSGTPNFESGDWVWQYPAK